MCVGGPDTMALVFLSDTVSLLSLHVEDTTGGGFLQSRRESSPELTLLSTSMLEFDSPE